MPDAKEKEVVVKICGLTNVADAFFCADAGAEMLGLNFSPQSMRVISVSTAREIIDEIRPPHSEVKFVGIFVDQELDFVRATVRTLNLDAVQLHGNEPVEYATQLGAPYLIKALRVAPHFSLTSAYVCDAILLDAWNVKGRGGTGETFDWKIAADFPRGNRQLFLAGGLTSDNVGAAIATVRPFAVDVCSGVEKEPGKKDRAKVHRFIAACR